MDIDMVYARLPAAAQSRAAICRAPWEAQLRELHGQLRRRLREGTADGQMAKGMPNTAWRIRRSMGWRRAHQMAPGTGQGKTVAKREGKAWRRPLPNTLDGKA